MLSLFLFVIAIVMFGVAGFIATPEPWHNRLGLSRAGLFCWCGAYQGWIPAPVIITL